MTIADVAKTLVSLRNTTTGDTSAAHQAVNHGLIRIPASHRNWCNHRGYNLAGRASGVFWKYGGES